MPAAIAEGPLFKGICVLGRWGHRPAGGGVKQRGGLGEVGGRWGGGRTGRAAAVMPAAAAVAAAAVAAAASCC